jgi:exonuclease III
MKILTLNLFLRPNFVNSINKSVYNYWKKNISFREIFSGDFKESRLNKFFKIVKKENYDVICLQEIFTDPFNKRITMLEKFAQDNDYFLYHPKNNKFCSIKTNSGLAILSKYDLLDCNFIEYKSSIGFPNSLSTCGFVHVNFKLSDEISVNLINVHLQSGPYNWQQNIRYKQLFEIKRYIDENISLDTMIIITGDFNANCKLWSKIYKIFPYLYDPFKGKELNDNYTFHIPYTCNVQRFDGILISEKYKNKIESRVDPIKIEKIGYFKTISDHCSIISNISIV